MKHDLFDLKVVKVKEDDDYYYFICKHIFANTYVEIFTKKKITVADESYVEPLRNYYSLLASHNFATNKSLKLSIKELITKYVNINRCYNKYGDKSYQMERYYDADNLVVANLERISNDVIEGGPMVEETDQKYIFELIYDGKSTKYREVFTGFMAADEGEYFNLPYVVNPVPITDYIPEIKGKQIPKLSLIWTLNDINFNREKEDVKELVKQQ